MVNAYHIQTADTSLTVPAYVEDGCPAYEAIGVVVLAHLIGYVVFPPYLIRDGPSNGMQEVSVKTRKWEGGRDGGRREKKKERNVKEGGRKRKKGGERREEGERKGGYDISYRKLSLSDLTRSSPFPLPPCNSESLWEEGCEQHSIVEGTMGALCVAKGRYP